ncbi:bifunctional diguanylate cyclase/phosphodiesterase [Algicella marina]|uniref:diguanylate cyclase n=1 Tax=Algicella marina TaxID=2683284 RepID=A0A6P1T0Q8_9RHOB|nr:diguanylate cyclase [Algicella marina]QHQ34869.1 diguanylate cyclase [Algicella marina]
MVSSDGSQARLRQKHSGRAPFLNDYYALLVASQTADGMVVCDRDERIVWNNPSFARLMQADVDGVVASQIGSLLGRERLGEDMLSGEPVAVPLGGAFLEMRWMALKTTADDTPLHLGTFRPCPPPASDTKATDREQISREERKLLSQTSGWFYAAKSLDELLKIVSKCMKTLFPEAYGQLYIYADSRDVLELAGHWGVGFLTDHIEPDDCWSLRRGRAYAYGNNDIDFACVHKDGDDCPSFCLPVVAHGDTIGMLHLAFPDIRLHNITRAELARLMDPRWDLALICAEQISLAVANVRLRQELQNQSVRDQLTGLWNRRWFLETAQKELNRTMARRGSLSLVALDVDHFKKYNDSHGHDAGDAVLKSLGALMREHFTGDAFACRVGGEEFSIIAPSTDAEAAFDMADRFRREVARMKIRSAGREMPDVTVSCGVATVPDCGDDLETLMKTADLALYRAKEAGRNCVVSHSQSEQKA